MAASKRVNQLFTAPSDGLNKHSPGKKLVCSKILKLTGALAIAALTGVAIYFTAGVIPMACFLGAAACFALSKLETITDFFKKASSTDSNNDQLKNSFYSFLEENFTKNSSENFCIQLQTPMDDNFTKYNEAKKTLENENASEEEKTSAEQIIQQVKNQVKRDMPRGYRLRINDELIYDSKNLPSDQSDAEAFIDTAVNNLFDNYPQAASFLHQGFDAPVVEFFMKFTYSLSSFISCQNTHPCDFSLHVSENRSFIESFKVFTFYYFDNEESQTSFIRIRIKTTMDLNTPDRQTCEILNIWEENQTLQENGSFPKHDAFLS